MLRVGCLPHLPGITAFPLRGNIRAAHPPVRLGAAGLAAFSRAGATEQAQTMEGRHYRWTCLSVPHREPPTLKSALLTPHIV